MKKKIRNLFSGRIFLAALRRLMFGAVICAALLVLVGAIISTEIVSQCDYEPTDQVVRNDYDAEAVMISSHVPFSPIVLFSFASPIFVFAAFSFARKKKEADLFLALPYSNTAIFFGTYAAALATVLVTGFLSGIGAWLPFIFSENIGINPSAFLNCFVTFAVNTFLLSGFAAIAVALTGRLFSCVSVFAALIAVEVCFRSSLSLITARAQSFSDSVHTAILSARWYLPIELFPGFSLWELLTKNYSSGIFNNAPRLIYHLVASLAAVLLACLLWNGRRSDAAGCPASSQRHYRFIRGGMWSFIGLIAASSLLTILPFDLSKFRFHLNYLHTILIFAISAAVVMFLIIPAFFERGLKKYFRRSCRCGWLILIFPITAGACLAAFLGVISIINNEKISADEIAHVEYIRSYGYSYGSHILEEASKTADFSEDFVTQLGNIHDKSRGKDLYRSGHKYVKYEAVVTMKNGKVLHRAVLHDLIVPDTCPEMKLIQSSAEVREAYLRLPEADELKTLQVYRGYGGDMNSRVIHTWPLKYSDEEDNPAVKQMQEEAKQFIDTLWEIFLEEYGQLTDEQKIDMLSYNWQSRINAQFSSEPSSPFYFRTNTVDETGRTSYDVYALEESMFPTTIRFISNEILKIPR